MKIFKRIPLPFFLLVFLIVAVYWQFFVQGKIPIPADLLVGAYWPWLDYKWGNVVGVAVKNPIISDAFSQSLPWKYLAINLFKNWTFPLWNQYSLSGSPLLANYQSSPFFPFNLILLLPKYFGWGVYIFCQTLVAALGMYFLIGKHIKSETSKVAGAIVFSLSGLMTTWVELGILVWSAAMLPWIFYFLEMYFEQKKKIFLILVSVSASLLFLSGNSQLTFYSVLLYICFLLYSCIKKKISVRENVLAFLALVFAIGLAAVELIPSYFQVASSIRSLEDYSKLFLVQYGLTPWYHFIRLFAADFFGNPTTYNYWSKISYHENSFFVGTLTLPLILPLLFKRFRKGETGFWLFVFFVSIFLGLDSPIMRFVYNHNLPFFTYSSAARIFFITSFAAGILVSIGIDRLIENSKFKKYTIISAILLGCVILSAILYSKIINIPSVNIIISLRNSILPLGLLVLFVAAIISKIPKKIIAILITLLIFLDLSRFFLKYNTFCNQNIIFPETPIIAFLQDQSGLFRIARLNRRILPPNTWIPYGFSSVEGYDALASSDYLHFFNRINHAPYFSYASRYAEIYAADFKYLDVLNVKYLLSVESDSEKLKYDLKANNLKEVFTDKSVVIYENGNVLPRAFFVNNLQTVKNYQDLASIIDNKDFDPRNSAIILSDKSITLNPSIGQTTIEKYEANSLKIRTTSTGDGFLIISDSFDLGWKAKIDSSPAKIFEVDGALRGIIVPAGTHEIEMEYWPDSVDWGVKISLFSLAIITVAGLYYLRKKN